MKSKAKAKQLFEMMDKPSGSQAKATDDNQLKLNSIFSTTEKNKKQNEIKSQAQVRPERNLFESINFNQVNEKKTENNNFSKVSKTATNAKSESKLALKNKNKYSKYSKEIDHLKTQIDSLMKMNEKLFKKVNKSETKKETKIEDNVISFIENYDKKVDNLKTKLRTNKKNIEKSIADKEDMFSEIFSETTQRFTELKTNLKSLGHQVDHIAEKQTEAENKIKNGLEIDNLSVNNNLDINGVLFSKKLIAEEINLENLQINSSNIKVGKDTQLQVGNEIIPFEKVIQNLDYISKLKDYCGEHFEKCNLISAEKSDAQNLQQEHILKNLKKLRSETSQAIRKKHRNNY